MQSCSPGSLPARGRGQKLSARQARAAADADLVHLVQARPPGDRAREAAYEELIRRFRPIVQSYAVRYLYSPEMQEELMQAGYIGLLTAINNFDPVIGNSLAAYARPCISGEVKRYFRDKRWQVRVQRSAQELRAQVLRCENELTQRIGRSPTDAEIAQELDLEPTAIAQARAADRAFHPLSLDAPFSADPDGGTLGDVLGATDDELDTIVGMESVWVHLAELPEREQAIVRMRFYGNMSQSQIAGQLGISQMHVSRLLARALRYLRDKIVDPEPRRETRPVNGRPGAVS